MLSEDLLAWLADATRVEPFDDALFDVKAGGDLAARLQGVVAAVKAADPDVLLRRQSPRHWLLGADVEARIQFALARKAACRGLAQAAEAAQATVRMTQSLEDALGTVTADHRRLADVAAMAHDTGRRFPPPATPEAQELRRRFDRRFSNLQSLRASNALTLAQIPAAIAHHRQLLDRFTDLNTMLFPVWERHALAVLQSPRDGNAVSAFRAAARRLVERLADRVEAAA